LHGNNDGALHEDAERGNLHENGEDRSLEEEIRHALLEHADDDATHRHTQEVMHH